MTEPLTAEQVAEFREMVADGRMGFVDERARLLATIDALTAERDEARADAGMWELHDTQQRARCVEHLKELKSSRDRIASLERVVEAAREFRDNGTVLTVCGGGPCQRVIEYSDNSDPQAKLFAALKAHDAVGAPTADREGTGSGGINSQIDGVEDRAEAPDEPEGFGNG
ncbi:MAG: hypothetical protein VW338_00170 [Rhodospirillaceae bacterium]